MFLNKNKPEMFTIKIKLYEIKKAKYYSSKNRK